MPEEQKSNQLQEIMDKLESGVKDFFQSKKYMEYLKIMSKFHNYSLNNTLLICMQKPGATLVAGYNAWQNVFERQVVKGEKGIKILAPVSYKKEIMKDKIDPASGLPMRDSEGRVIKEKAEVKYIKFKVVNVFDISQTEGKEIPEMVTTLRGNVEQFQDFLFALEEVSPVPVGFEKITGKAHGYFHIVENRIAINQGESQMQTIKTLIHEIAHARLHSLDGKASNAEQIQQSRRSKEVEAESVAYVVCQHFGIDTSEYSFGYIAGWSSGKNIEELKESLELIRDTSSKFISEIEEKLQERQQTKEVGNRTSVLDKLKSNKNALQSSNAKDAKMMQRSEVIR